jgi:hypothetical protein
MESSKKTARPRGVRWVLGLLVVALAALMVPAIASAQEEPKRHYIPDPMESVIPSFNNNGGVTRLQKCFSLTHDVVELEKWYVDSGFGLILGKKMNATHVLENWTGSGLGPVSTNSNRSIVVKGTFRPHKGPVRETRDGRRIKSYLCFSSDWTSQKAGLAVIKATYSGPALEAILKFSYRRSIDFEIGLNENEVLDQHVYLTGWLQLTNPVLTNEADGFDTDGITKTKNAKGEIANMAGKSGYDLQLRVKYLLPLGSKKGSFGKDVAVLPDDYAALAAAFAVSSNPDCSIPGQCPLAWDVHDDWNSPADSKSKPEHNLDQHVYGKCIYKTGSSDKPVATVDQVDNCLGGHSFTTVFGTLSGSPTMGPFDPLLPRETLLSDGKTDAGDFQGPPTRATIWIDQNSGAKGDISGAGYLGEVDKEDVYNVDWNGNGSWASKNKHGKYVADPHELYAPFYTTYIPATSRGPLSSGTTGVKNPNNFAGYLRFGGYDYWEFADYKENGHTYTECVRDYGHDSDGKRNESSDIAYMPNQRPAPYGAYSVEIYLDEHGEGGVHWYPGEGFYYDSIPGVTTDNNGACDLQGKPILGTSAIQAEVQNPYQPVFGEGRYKSNIVRKDVLNGFNKALYFEQKVTNDNSRDAWHVTAWYTEIDGNGPGAHERVCFSTGANGLISGSPSSPGKATQSPPLYKGWTCIRMQDGIYENGAISPDLAGVTVTSTDGAPVTVFADFIDERIKRTIVVGEKSGGTAPPAPGDGKAGGTAPKGAGTTTPTAAAFKAAGVAVPQVAARALKVQRAKFKKVRAHGAIKRGIVFAKFVSPTNRIKANVQLMGFKNGKLSVLKTFKVTKKANTKKMIRVKVLKNKKLVKKVRSIRVTPIKAVGKLVIA